MVSPKPVPSRAALNALRGLVFTTSCSVVLLAEERRRRTKIARTAIENARKLHTIKAQRRPLAMSDSRHADPDPDRGTLDRPAGTPPRRKKRLRRSSNGHEGGVSPGDGDRQPKTNVTDNQPAHALIDAASAYAPNASDRPRAVSPTASLEFNSVLAAPKHIQARLSPLIPILKIGKALFNRDTRDRYWSGTEPNNQQAPDTIVSKPNGLSGANQGMVEEMDELYEAVVAYLKSRKPGRRICAASHLLRKLCEQLDSASVSEERIVRYQQVALLLVTKAMPHDANETSEADLASFKYYSLRLLRSVVFVGGVALPRAVDGIKHLHRDIPYFIAAILQFLTEAGNRDGMVDLLRYLARQPRAGFVLDSSSVFELLHSHYKRYKNLADTRRVGHALVDGQVCHFANIPHGLDYEIESFILKYTYRSDGASSTCVDAFRRILQIDESRAKSDPDLCKPFVIAKALVGDSEGVEDELRRLEELDGSGSDGLLVVLQRLTDIYAPLIGPQAFEGVLRTFADKYGMPLKGRWLYQVLKYHSERLDEAAMFSFLEFAVKSGYELTDDFFHNFCQLWYKKWGVSTTSILQLYRSLAEVAPGLSRPDAFIRDGKYGRNSPYSVEEDWEAVYIRSTEWIDAARLPDQSVFASLREDALAGKWESVWATYDQTFSAHRLPCIRSLRLAVLARLKLDSGATDRTAKLVMEAHERGLDANHLVTPLLLAQIDEGRDPVEVVRDSVRQGFKVHDMVYNRAARRLSAAGKLNDMVTVCNMATLENGGRDPCYNGVNLVNLVYAYTGLRYYDQLRDILSKFMEEKRFWAGSKVVMDSLKLAMKKVAGRLTAATDAPTLRREEAMMAKLNDAHLHCTDCKRDQNERQSMIDSAVRVCNEPVAKRTADAPSRLGKGEPEPSQGPIPPETPVFDRRPETAEEPRDAPGRGGGWRPAEAPRSPGPTGRLSNKRTDAPGSSARRKMEDAVSVEAEMRKNLRQGDVSENRGGTRSRKSQGTVYYWQDEGATGGLQPREDAAAAW